VGCIILGRGEDAKKVRDWLTTAARVPGFIGFRGGADRVLGCARCVASPEDDAGGGRGRDRAPLQGFVDTFETARALSSTRTE